MKKLKQLLERVNYTWVQGEEKDYDIDGLSHNSADAQTGKKLLFVCVKGARFDTHTIIDEIYEKCGSQAVFVTAQKVVTVNKTIPILQVSDTRLAAALLAAAWYDYPADRLDKIIGITGSKGKTTVTHMLADILRADGHKVGTIGTNGAIVQNKIYELSNTTPDAMEVQMYLAMMADAGCDTVVVECSSQGLMQHRVSGFTFDYGVFTNISRGDHVGPNEHKTFEEYMYCKGLLMANSKCAVVYGEDENLEGVMKQVPSSIPVIRFGRNSDDDYYAYDEEKTYTDRDPGLRFKIGGKASLQVDVNLPGEFNVTNALAAVSVAKELDTSDEAVKEALNHMSIKGRLDMVFRNDIFSVCVDFAHNGYSTRNLLEALREYRPKRLVCIFGADGNRAKSRRYEMGEASGRLADLSIVTSGHNRFETFEQILADIMVGLEPTGGSYMVIPDRKEAIRYAIGHAKEGDVITIIGLGHESYQEEQGHKYPYSDTEFVRSVVRDLGYLD